MIILEKTIGEIIILKLLRFWIWTVVAIIVIIASIYFEIYEIMYATIIFMILLLIFGSTYDQDGYDITGRDCNEYNKDGYDYDGFDRFGFDKDGYDEAGFNTDGFNRYKETKKEVKKEKEIKDLVKEIEQVNYKIAQYKGNILSTSGDEKTHTDYKKLVEFEAKLNILNIKLKVLISQ